MHNRPYAVPTITESLEKIIEAVGPRVYQLELGDSENVNFIVFGCQGSADAQQHKTSRLINQVIASESEKPKFILILGDNLYEYGETDPNGPLFKTCFDDPYSNPTLHHVSQLPCFLILGNHDGNYHSKAYFSNNPVGRETEKYEVMHTYHKQPDTYQRLFEQSTLNLASVPKWSMPYFYYSLIAGDLQIFCLSSSEYIAAFIEYESKRDRDPNNQAAWLKREYAKAKQAGYRIAFAMHHPLYTAGKRAFPEKYDSSHYLTPAQIREANKLMGTDTHSYNQLIDFAFQHQMLNPDIIFAAHDHSISFTQKDSCQLILGGGGGTLQSRESFASHPNVATHLKQNGFCLVNYKRQSPEHINFHIHTTEGLHLHFQHDKLYAIRQKCLDNKTEMLRQYVLEACDTFFCRLRTNELKSMDVNANKQPEDYGQLYRLYDTSKWFMSQAAKALRNYLLPDNQKKEVVVAQHLAAFFDQPNLPLYEECLDTIQSLIQPLVGLPVEDSFLDLLRSTLGKEHNIKVSDLIDLPEKKMEASLL